ncbi:hypothetical protein HXX76_000127 [Chlamydomonas incerta]|uniref:Uncharacterized protein n=1 Tax=Chlamydomonas incerta TaxID=51695 RepID=A0A835WDQ6_CHLIN|nr:hypothetical protein HXX76_000127 [Chlamydomonas incerta]|eukprot:KAG2445511.1 hypothetical protein HXX76_000127 [Chlamydomonas incerta]
MHYDYGDQQQSFGLLLDSDECVQEHAAEAVVPAEPSRDPWRAPALAAESVAGAGAAQHFQPRAASTPPEHLNPNILHGASGAASRSGAPTSAARAPQASARGGSSHSPQRRCLTPTPASPPRHLGHQQQAPPQQDANTAAAAISKLLHTEELIDHHAAILDRSFSPGILTRERELGNRLGWQAASGVLGRARLMHSKGAVPSNLALNRMAAAAQSGGAGAKGAGGAGGGGGSGGSGGGPSTWMEQHGPGRAEHGSAEWVARAAVLTTQARPRAGATAKAAAVAARSRFDKGHLLHLIVNNAEPAAVVAAAAGLVRGPHAGAAAAAASAAATPSAAASAPVDEDDQGAAACEPAAGYSEPLPQLGVSFACEAATGDDWQEGNGGESDDDDTGELNVEDVGGAWKAAAGARVEGLRAGSYSHGGGLSGGGFAGSAARGPRVTELERLRRRSIGELPLLAGLRRSSQGFSSGALSNFGGGPSSSHGGTSTSNSCSGFGEAGNGGGGGVSEDCMLALPSSPHSASGGAGAACGGGKSSGGAFPPPPILPPSRGGSGVQAALSPTPSTSNAAAAGANSSSGVPSSSGGCASPSLLRPSGRALRPSASNSNRQPPLAPALPPGGNGASTLGHAAGACHHKHQQGALSPLSPSRLFPTGSAAAVPRRDMFSAMAAAASAAVGARDSVAGAEDPGGHAAYTFGGGGGSSSSQSAPRTDYFDVLLPGPSSAPAPDPNAGPVHGMSGSVAAASAATRRLPSRIASSGSCVASTHRQQQQQQQQQQQRPTTAAIAAAAASGPPPPAPEDGSYPRWDGSYQMQLLTDNYNRRRLPSAMSPSQSPQPGARTAATAAAASSEATARGNDASRRQSIDMGSLAAARRRARLSGGVLGVSETGDADCARPRSVRGSTGVSDRVSEGGSESGSDGEGKAAPAAGASCRRPEAEEWAGGWQALAARPATPSAELAAAATAHAHGGDGRGDGATIMRLEAVSQPLPASYRHGGVITSMAQGPGSGSGINELDGAGADANGGIFTTAGALGVRCVSAMGGSGADAAAGANCNAPAPSAAAMPHPPSAQHLVLPPPHPSDGAGEPAAPGRRRVRLCGPSSLQPVAATAAAAASSDDDTSPSEPTSSCGLPLATARSQGAAAANGGDGPDSPLPALEPRPPAAVAGRVADGRSRRRSLDESWLETQRQLLASAGGPRTAGVVVGSRPGTPLQPSQLVPMAPRGGSWAAASAAGAAAAVGSATSRNGAPGTRPGTSAAAVNGSSGGSAATVSARRSSWAAYGDAAAVGNDLGAQLSAQGQPHGQQQQQQQPLQASSGPAGLAQQGTRLGPTTEDGKGVMSRLFKAFNHLRKVEAAAHDL